MSRFDRYELVVDGEDVCLIAHGCIGENSMRAQGARIVVPISAPAKVS